MTPTYVIDPGTNPDDADAFLAARLAGLLEQEQPADVSALVQVIGAIRAGRLRCVDVLIRAATDTLTTGLA